MSNFETVKWLKNGDHPFDESDGNVEGKIIRRYRDPDIPDNQICHICKNKMIDHGWIDIPGLINSVVCPGDYVAKNIIDNDICKVLDIFDMCTYDQLVNIIFPLLSERIENM